MLKSILSVTFFVMLSFMLIMLDFIEFNLLCFFLKINIFYFASSAHVSLVLLFSLHLSWLFCKIYFMLSSLFLSFSLYYSLLKNSAILTFLSLCFKSFIIFVLIVTIRVATPRFKIESLTKIGWLYCLLFILVCLVIYVSGYFFF